jgi:cob(I)alamin adenosyltransferase
VAEVKNKKRRISEMSGEGLVQIYTGDGKGKTTAAVGLAVRAAGAGLSVMFAQFLKGRATGELEPLKKLGVTVVRSEAVTKFIPYMMPAELDKCRSAQHAVLDAVKDGIAQSDVVILDEVCGAITTGMIDIGDIISLIRQKPQSVELVLTGRGAPAQLLELADYISEIKSVKHPYDKGISARKGIEY